MLSVRWFCPIVNRLASHARGCAAMCHSDFSIRKLNGEWKDLILQISKNLNYISSQQILQIVQNVKSLKVLKYSWVSFSNQSSESADFKQRFVGRQRTTERCFIPENCNWKFCKRYVFKLTVHLPDKGNF